MAKVIRIEHKTSLNAEEIRKKAESLISDAISEYGDSVQIVEQRWAGDTLTFSLRAQAVLVSGAVTVQDKKINLTANLPFPASMIAGGIKAKIIEKAKELFPR